MQSNRSASVPGRRQGRAKAVSPSGAARPFAPCIVEALTHIRCPTHLSINSEGIKRLVFPGWAFLGGTIAATAAIMPASRSQRGPALLTTASFTDDELGEI